MPFKKSSVLSVHSIRLIVQVSLNYSAASTQQSMSHSAAGVILPLATRAMIYIANGKAEIDHCKFQSTSAVVKACSALMLAFSNASFVHGRLGLVLMC